MISKRQRYSDGSANAGAASSGNGSLTRNKSNNNTLPANSNSNNNKRRRTTLERSRSNSSAGSSNSTQPHGLRTRLSVPVTKYERRWRRRRCCCCCSYWEWRIDTEQNKWECGRSCFVLDVKVRISSSSDNMFRTFQIILLIWSITVIIFLVCCVYYFIWFSTNYL